MKKIVLVHESPNESDNSLFDEYVGRFQTEKYRERTIFCVGNKISQFVKSDKDTLIIYNPTNAILQMLVNIDLITSAVNFNVYRIYLGDVNNIECPDNYDFVANSNKQFDFIFSLDKGE